MYAAPNKRLPTVFVILVVALTCAPLSPSKDDSLLVQGVVLAIQRGKTDLRILDAEPLADMAEIYMIRVDHWSPPVRKEKYILLEYVHHTGFIGCKRFNRTHSNFELHPESPETNQEGLS
jgi:hypothetical protein